MAKEKSGGVASNAFACECAFLCMRMFGIIEEYYVVAIDVEWEIERDALLRAGLARGIKHLMATPVMSRLDARNGDAPEGAWGVLAKRYADIGAGLVSSRPRLARLQPWAGAFGAWIELDLGFEDCRELEPGFGARKARSALKAKAAAMVLDWPASAPIAGPVWLSGKSAGEGDDAIVSLGLSLRAQREARALEKVAAAGSMSQKFKSL